MSLRNLLHERWRTRVSLLAARCLEGGEQRAALAHLDSCTECRGDYEAALAMLETLAADPARDAELPVPVAFLVTRVEARVEALTQSRPFRWATLALGLGVAVVVLSVVLPWILPRVVTPIVDRVASLGGELAPSSEEPVAMDDAALRRVERTVAREQAVRYLSEAQDVLMTVASTPHACPLKARHVDLSAESRRSRELVTRRALLLALDDDSVASARHVIEDVDHVLREVATLDPCVDPEEVARVQQQMEQGRLLMKIRLMSRELVG
jgi:hypothetical protein